VGERDRGIEEWGCSRLTLPSHAPWTEGGEAREKALAASELHLARSKQLSDSRMGRCPVASSRLAGVPEGVW
jgi:hypothetical protein